MNAARGAEWLTVTSNQKIIQNSYTGANFNSVTPDTVKLGFYLDVHQRLSNIIDRVTFAGKTIKSNRNDE